MLACFIIAAAGALFYFDRLAHDHPMGVHVEPRPRWTWRQWVVYVLLLAYTSMWVISRFA